MRSEIVEHRFESSRPVVELADGDFHAVTGPR